MRSWRRSGGVTGGPVRAQRPGLGPHGRRHRAARGDLSAWPGRAAERRRPLGNRVEYDGRFEPGFACLRLRYLRVGQGSPRGGRPGALRRCRTRCRRPPSPPAPRRPRDPPYLFEAAASRLPTTHAWRLSANSIAATNGRRRGQAVGPDPVAAMSEEESRRMHQRSRIRLAGRRREVDSGRAAL